MARPAAKKLAKLTRPELYDVLARERLFALLAKRRQRPLLWVVGPPGAGKTTLVASYLDAEDLPNIWYQLDAGDNDVATFFHYLAQSLPSVRSSKSAHLPVPKAEHLSDVAGFTRYFFREFFARFKPPAVVVFDNYHELPADSPLHGVIAQAALELPQRVNLIVTSREDPPSEFARSEALDRLARIEWDELKLTYDEAKAITALRFQLDEKTLRALHSTANGWAAGLTLALERLKRGGEVQASQGEALESVFNYFAGQIFKTVAPDARECLMRCALVQPITVAMAQEISGHAGAATLLEQFYKRSLFTDRRGDKPHSYRFHDLFRAFLLDRLEQMYSTLGLNELRQRAGMIMLAAQRHDEAFALFVEAQDWEASARLVLEHAPTLLDQGRSKRLSAWIEQLPTDQLEREPWLHYWMGMALLAHDPAAARVPLERAFEQFERANDRVGEIACSAGIVWSHEVEIASYRTRRTWVERLMALLESRPAFFSTSIELHTYTALAGWTQVMAHTDTRDPYTPRVLSLISSELPLNDRASAAIALLVGPLRETGELATAHAMVARLADSIDSNAVEAVNRAGWWQGLGWLHLSDGHPARAEETFQTSQAICRSHAIATPAQRIFTLMPLAVCAWRSDQLTLAEQYLTEMESLGNPVRYLERGWNAWIRSLISAARNDWERAAQFAREEVRILESEGARFYLYFARLHLATALIATQAYDEAHDHIEQARAIVRNPINYRNEADVDCMAAWLALAQGDQAKFEQHTRAALSLLKNTELHACLWYCDQRVIGGVLHAALQAGIEREFVTAIIRQQDVPPPAHAGREWPWPVTIATLGRFEINVNGVPLAFGRKTPKKPLAVLKAIIAAGAPKTGVAATLLIDSLWPDNEADAAAKALRMALMRLREVLGDADYVTANEGRIALDPKKVWVDAFAFEQATGPGVKANAEQAAALYQGTFLPDDRDAPWSIAYREQLRERFNRLVADQAAQAEKRGDFALALSWYERGLAADDLVEPLYQGQMRCYLKLERQAQALAVFERLRRTLATKLRASPSAESAALAASAQSAM